MLNYYIIINYTFKKYKIKKLISLTIFYFNLNFKKISQRAKLD